MFDRAAFERAGFSGFVSIGNLRRGLGGVPAAPRVYVVLREAENEPEFLGRSSGGHYKGVDPTVSVEVLRANWVEGANLVYVGQSTDVRDRIRLLLEFGAGKAVRHRGGEYLWQLVDAEECLVGWAESDEPLAVEQTVLRSFHSHYGKLPFANRRY